MPAATTVWTPRNIDLMANDVFRAEFLLASAVPGLPATYCADEGSKTPVSPANPALAVHHTRCALVIEDDDVNRRMIARILSSHGFSVDAVATAEDAFAIGDLTAYEVLVCDVRLPGIDGKTFVDLLHEEVGEALPHVVFVTACSAELVAPARCVEKPFSVAELVEAVAGLSRESTKTRPPSARVLVVDDEPALRRIMARALRTEFSVILASDLESALEHLRGDEQILAVVSDLMMNGPVGLDLLEEVKRRNPKCGRILVSAGTSIESDISDALASGTVQHFLSKPWAAGDLLATVRLAINDLDPTR